jgi:hypothetical protein
MKMGVSTSSRKRKTKQNDVNKGSSDRMDGRTDGVTHSFASVSDVSISLLLPLLLFIFRRSAMNDGDLLNAFIPSL